MTEPQVTNSPRTNTKSSLPSLSTVLNKSLSFHTLPHPLPLPVWSPLPSENHIPFSFALLPHIPVSPPLKSSFIPSTHLLSLASVLHLPFILSSTPLSLPTPLPCPTCSYLWNERMRQKMHTSKWA